MGRTQLKFRNAGRGTHTNSKPPGPPPPHPVTKLSKIPSQDSKHPTSNADESQTYDAFESSTSSALASGVHTISLSSHTTLLPAPPPSIDLTLLNTSLQHIPLAQLMNLTPEEARLLDVPEEKAGAPDVTLPNTEPHDSDEEDLDDWLDDQL